MNPLPMLAKPYDASKYPIRPFQYVAEVKHDGLRMICRVDSDHSISVWSRTGKDAKIGKLLSKDMRAKLQSLHEGVYDGELVIRGAKRSTSYEVSDHANIEKLSYVIFDLLELHGHNIQMLSYGSRRDTLEKALDGYTSDLVQLAKVWKLESNAHLDEICDEIWKEEGEGVIVKSVNSGYYTAKRSDAFLKLKKWRHAVLTVTGFEASKGEIVNRGRYAMTSLIDDDGNECQVKTLDDATCRKLEEVAGAAAPENHPWIGRKLMIEHTDRTPDGKYLMPHWDRWEDE